MSVSPILDIYSVEQTKDSNEITFPITFESNRSKEIVETQTLIDSGAGGTFIDQNYARKLNLETQLLETPLTARNVDGTVNKRGTIKSYVNLRFKLGDKTFDERFYVTGLGKQKFILGLPWLQRSNPKIDWKTGILSWPTNETDNSTTDTSSQERKDDNLEIDLDSIVTELENENDIWINAKTNLAMDMAIEENTKKADLSAEEIVPPAYHKFLDVFDKQKANRFPESTSWDHKIEMKEGFEPKSFKNYNLTPEEQTELDKFLKENLEKGYIRPSQSPMASPFFFVKKKDGKLRPCQDYRYLNDWTIKNAYPLPLISDIMDKLNGAKYFTKFDVRWGYNNIRIKQGDEWKAAFKTNRGLFEPTVMFFGMCNSPATFQAMMNTIFEDLIDERIIIIYMDDILIFAKSPEELEHSTRRVLERLLKHDLYLKPKKCEFNKT
jgi:hypothetical protein